MTEQFNQLLNTLGQLFAEHGVEGTILIVALAMVIIGRIKGKISWSGELSLNQPKEAKQDKKSKIGFLDLTQHKG